MNTAQMQQLGQLQLLQAHQAAARAQAGSNSSSSSNPSASPNLQQHHPLSASSPAPNVQQLHQQRGSPAMVAAAVAGSQQVNAALANGIPASANSPESIINALISQVPAEALGHLVKPLCKFDRFGLAFVFPEFN
jgi:hypothetical protein